MYPERDHVLASNVQSLIIVSSYLAPRVKWGLIDRYLVLAELQNIEPIIILNKLDLLNEAAAEHPDFVRQCHERTQYYRDLGYEVYSLQANAKKARSHAEIKRLMAKLSNRISMFSGHSGVGKSSLVNLLSPDIVQDVEPDSDIFYKGRHTTSYASFLGLGIGGYVIDTPGIRSFVIDRYGPIELSYGFREIRPFAEKCKFRECRHIDEPACAVLEAVESGVIVNWRYQHYRGILLGTSGREGRQRQDELSPEELEDLFGSDT
jgi:ribosome biogenesis GTPase